MKFKTTKKEIRSNYPRVISVNYCSLQNLLESENPIAYTTTVYGWGADIYQINQRTVIVTGYAPFGNIEPKTETIIKYENEAAKIIYKRYKKWETTKRKLKELQEKFVNEVCENEKN